MQILFEKIHANGNDFIVIDNIGGQYSYIKERKDIIQNICHRKYGIGSDGLIYIDRSSMFDFDYVFFNPDGTSAFCANGSRAIVWKAYTDGIAKNRNVQFSSIEGQHQAEVLDNTSKVRVKMLDFSKPIDSVLQGFTLHTGTPHFVKKVESVDNIDIYKEAYPIRHNTIFAPQGININFMQIKHTYTLFVRTYEKGVEDETLSCGTGVIASSIVYAQYLECGDIEIDVLTKGGPIRVYMHKIANNTYSDIWLEGKVISVFKGVYNLD